MIDTGNVVITFKAQEVSKGIFQDSMTVKYPDGKVKTSLMGNRYKYDYHPNLGFVRYEWVDKHKNGGGD